MGHLITLLNSSKKLVIDSFNRPDNALTLGVSDTGQTWTNHAGALGIQSGKVYMPSVGTSIATVDSGKSSVSLSFKDSGIQDAGLFNGIVVRYSDTSNYVRIVLQTTTLYIQRRQTGTTTIIATTTITRADGDKYRIVASPTAITVYQNGISVLSVNETFNATATRQGIIISSVLPRMDDFIVEEL